MHPAWCTVLTRGTLLYELSTSEKIKYVHCRICTKGPAWPVFLACCTVHILRQFHLVGFWYVRKGSGKGIWLPEKQEYLTLTVKMTRSNKNPGISRWLKRAPNKIPPGRQYSWKSTSMRSRNTPSPTYGWVWDPHTHNTHLVHLVILSLFGPRVTGSNPDLIWFYHINSGSP